MMKMHIAEIQTGRFLLIGSRDKAVDFCSKYQKDGYKPKLDSDDCNVFMSNSVSVQWMSEQGIKKVIIL